VSSAVLVALELLCAEAQALAGHAWRVRRWLQIPPHLCGEEPLLLIHEMRIRLLSPSGVNGACRLLMSKRACLRLHRCKSLG
jgi:hypothetical protein